MVLQRIRDFKKNSLVRKPPKPDLPNVNFTKTFPIISGLFLTGQLTAPAQTGNVNFTFNGGSVANYRQSPEGVNYQGGTYDVFLRDGFITYLPGCIAPFYFPPGGGCPPGASGFITAGDFDGDGIEDPGQYLSVTNIASAVIVEPFRPEEIRLISAPPSLIPRPLAGFTNDSRSLFFDIQTTAIRQYAVTQYEFSRVYTSSERTRFDKEIVPGNYQYAFPSLSSDTIPAIVSINNFQTLDGYRKINNQRVGFRFTDVTFDDGFAVLNPFQINTFRWEGNTPAFISPGVDRLFFSIKPLTDPFDPTSDPVQYDPENLEFPNPTLPIFPNFLGPEASRVVLPSPLDNRYILPPNFLAPGATGVVDLEFVLFRPTNNVVFDQSTRRFRLPVRVTDPFFIPPPPEASEAAFNSANEDFDGDGVSNFTEWVFGSDRADASSVPETPSLNFVSAPPASQVSKSDSGVSTLSDEVAPEGAWEFVVQKKQNAVPALQYDIERSTNMVDWEVVQDDENWIVIEDAFVKKIISRDPNVSGGAFFRAKVQTK